MFKVEKPKSDILRFPSVSRRRFCKDTKCWWREAQAEAVAATEARGEERGRRCSRSPRASDLGDRLHADGSAPGLQPAAGSRSGLYPLEVISIRVKKENGSTWRSRPRSAFPHLLFYRKVLHPQQTPKLIIRYSLSFESWLSREYDSRSHQDNKYLRRSCEDVFHSDDVVVIYHFHYWYFLFYLSAHVSGLYLILFIAIGVVIGFKVIIMPRKPYPIF